MATKSNLMLELIHSASSSATPSDARTHRGIFRDVGAQDPQHVEVAKQIVKTIAIVDDDADICSMFSMLVKRLGYFVDFIAHDGTEIVSAVDEGRIHPDVILMDNRMPRMNGLQAAAIVVKKLPDVKIIILSADDSIRQSTLSAGLFFVQKPCRAALIKSLLESL
jgi:CheY-like chemotaxis protein